MRGLAGRSTNSLTRNAPGGLRHSATIEAPGGMRLAYDVGNLQLITYALGSAGCGLASAIAVPPDARSKRCEIVNRAKTSGR